MQHVLYQTFALCGRQAWTVLLGLRIAVESRSETAVKSVNTGKCDYTRMEPPMASGTWRRGQPRRYEKKRRKRKGKKEESSADTTVALTRAETWGEAVASWPSNLKFKLFTCVYSLLGVEKPALDRLLLWYHVIDIAQTVPRM